MEWNEIGIIKVYSHGTPNLSDKGKCSLRTIKDNLSCWVLRAPTQKHTNKKIWVFSFKNQIYLYMLTLV